MGNGTPIGRVRGLGSAKSGTHHWLMQRFTAAGNVLLTGFFAISLLLLPDHGYATMREWIAQPVPATALGLMIISVFWHARLGLQVLLEDYLHEAGAKFTALIVLNLAAIGGGAFGLFCIIRLALGGAA
ncbi:succinate dehydrogenase, hydrophobic membrane anchor protein [Altericroceibacterium endophyticum]|uniref:Succinate dehydrogenase hydrophobic membrane anchor subunit n=1 Tax=Altericroceibacterium endophyticum TaxID=1808508 RepID=A0A6I4T4U4_9SPHN|nr:succinate dehydrogenase, hydrophobic membrane anchor protein [Altericroceibacterium endophyticum]MXO64695.1 succinate dehydrogenase, hydrophobic membrane anchor protein [Altericroceibacterium endophyticum]